jgi:hypothetical protein
MNSQPQSRWMAEPKGRYLEYSVSPGLSLLEIAGAPPLLEILLSPNSKAPDGLTKGL